MSVNKLIFISGFIGLVSLFLFPEPENNFTWYILTIFGFIVFIVVLFWLNKK